MVEKWVDHLALPSVVQTVVSSASKLVGQMVACWAAHLAAWKGAR